MSNYNLTCLAMFGMLLLGTVAAVSSFIEVVMAQLGQFPALDSAQHISEVDLPVYDQPPFAHVGAANATQTLNTTSVKAIDFQTVQTYGSPFVTDAQFQNESLALQTKEYYDCLIRLSQPLYDEQGIAFKNESKAEYLDAMETCIAVQWVISSLQSDLMQLSPMERALKGFG